ncbi:MAG TPA: ACT domain-containing protein [Polyangia bacterium]|jgi:Glycine cleavage system regulatory protein|nr:ACT domain-containing protein [Polyangia bacterium]
MTDLVLTLIGPDRPGLVEAVAEVIAGHGGNWLESRMAHLAGKFAGILRVEVPAAQVLPLSAALAALQERGLRVVAEPSAGSEQPAADEARTMDLELVGLDRPGIVREISQILARSGANVEELATNRSSAPMSGEMLFSAKTRVRLPPHADVARLRAGLERMASDLMVEIRLVETALEAKGRAR